MLRALAMVFVFLYHYAGFLSPLTQGAPWLDALEELVLRLGSIGTNLFLLLAGLFVARSVARDNFRYGAFLARRVIRIYPPYLLVVVAALLFWLVFPGFARFPHGGPPLCVFWETECLLDIELDHGGIRRAPLAALHAPEAGRTCRVAHRDFMRCVVGLCRPGLLHISGQPSHR